MAATNEARHWSCSELETLLGDAGRVSIEKLTKKLGRTREELEWVVARLRAFGYPVSLTLAICPMCGNMAPIVYGEGICWPCHYRRALERTQAQIASLLPLLSPEDRKTYEDTEAQLGGYIIEGMPTSRSPRSTANALNRVREEDKALASLSDWEARRIRRALKASQKRKERISRKARANGYVPKANEQRGQANVARF